MFKWKYEEGWWELVHFDWLGLPASYNFGIPDKFCHAFIVFGLTWWLSKWFNRWTAFLLGWGFMMGPWEIIWDGILSNGASWKDMVANTVGGLICVWLLGSNNLRNQFCEEDTWL